MLNAADFGDLLLECIRLFRENPEVLAQYQQRFKYILVDEYQDTNVAQYLWLRLIAQRAVPASAIDAAASGPFVQPRCDLGDRRRTSAASATTTSRSTAGAAPRSTTSCASSTTSPAPR